MSEPPEVRPAFAEKIEHWPLDRLQEYERNPRTHDAAQVEAIAASIARFGFNNPILVDGNSGIVAGHGRLAAARHLGLEAVPVVVLDHLSEADRRAYLIADNRLAELAGWDSQLLLEELEACAADLGGTEGMGFSARDVEALRAIEHDRQGIPPEEDVQPPPENPIVKAGEVWECGEHLVACADCRDLDQVRQVLGDRLVDLAFTSPPYASQRTYDPGSDFDPIPPDKYVAWFEPVQAAVRAVLAPHGSWFVNLKAHCEGGVRSLYVMDLVVAHVREWGWRFVEEYCWTHGGTPKQVAGRFKNGYEPVYQLQPDDHEPVLQFATAKHPRFRPGQVMHRTDEVPDWAGRHPNEERIQGGEGVERAAARSRQSASNAALQGSSAGGAEIHDQVAGRRAAGMAFPSNVISCGRNREALGHPAAFPVQLPAFFLRAYTDTGDLVLDPFGGSGSTLIAAQVLNRSCVSIDVSPAYAETTVRRWERMTDAVARRRGDGKTLDQLKPRRRRKRGKRAKAGG